MFYNPYNISKDGIHIKRRNFSTLWYYVSIWIYICLGQNIYTGPMIGTTYTVTQIQRPVHNRKNMNNGTYTD